MTTINITNSGSGSYTIDGTGSNSTISMIRGNTYNLVINANGHPFWIQTVPGGYSSNNIYSSGVTNNGSQNGTITFVVPNDAPDTLYYACQYHSSMQGSITITGSVSQSPTITDFSIPNQTYSSGATVTITTPTSTSSGAFSYTSSDTSIATVSGSIVTILKAGDVTITATQAAYGNYSSGTADAEFTIAKATTSITGFSIPNQTYSSGATVTITTPSSDNTSAFTYTSSDITTATVSGSIVTILKAGTVTITATQEADDKYTSTTADAEFTITKATPINSAFIISDQTYSSGATFTIPTPTSTSPGAFSYSSSNTNKATVSGSTVTILEAGTVTITRTQAETVNYTSTTADAEFDITKATPINSNFSISNQIYSSGATVTIPTPTSTSPGVFSYSSSNTNIATVAGSTVTILQVGNVTITRTQAETVNYTSDTATATFTISRATPTITNFSIPNQIYSSGATFTISPPTSTSTGAFSYASSDTNIATVSGTTITILRAGTITITATQEESDDYSSGSVTANFTSFVTLRSFSMSSSFTNNAQVYYKPNSLSTGGGGSGVKNSRHKQRRT